MFTNFLRCLAEGSLLMLYTGQFDFVVTPYDANQIKNALVHKKTITFPIAYLMVTLTPLKDDRTQYEVKDNGKIVLSIPIKNETWLTEIDRLTSS